MSLTENQNDIGKAVRKVLNKPAEEISLLEEDSPPEQSTPRVTKQRSPKRKRSRSPKYKKHSKKRRYAFSSSDESQHSDSKYQAESAASTIDEDEYDQIN